MAEQFDIEAKLKITGVDVKGDLNAGKLKFDIDTSALKSMVEAAGKAAEKVKAKFDNIKLLKLKIEVNKNSLISIAAQIRKTIEGAGGTVTVKANVVTATQTPSKASQTSAFNVSQGVKDTQKLAKSHNKLAKTIQSNDEETAKKALALQELIRNGGVVSSKKLAKTHNKLAKSIQAMDTATAKKALALQKVIRSDREASARKALTALEARTQREVQALRSRMSGDQAVAAQRTAQHRLALKEIDERTKREAAALKSRMSLQGMAIKNAPPAGGFSQGPRQANAGGTMGSVEGMFGGGGGGGGGGRGGRGASAGGPGGMGGPEGIPNLAGASRAMKQLSTATKEAETDMAKLERLSFEVGQKAATFRGVAIAINTIVTSVQAAVQFIIEFNDSLIELNKILQRSDQSVQQLGDELFSLAAKTGVAVDETIAVSEAFARAGLQGRGYGSVVQLTERALTGIQGTTLEASQATELFIQVLQQVEGGVKGLNKELITTTKLFDVLGKAEDITASKATDVQAAFKRSAASIFATGVTIEQATTLISVLQERTQRGGDVIGTALKTLASRISSSTSDATQALKEIGVETIDQEGNLRNLFDILRETSVAFQGLSEAEQANIGVKVAGIRQVEVFRAAVSNFNRIIEVNNELMGASGDAARKQVEEQKKISNVISRLVTGFKQLARTTSEGIIGTVFVFALNTIEKLVTTVAALDRSMGGALSTFAGIGAIVIAGKALIPMFKGMFKAAMSFVGATTTAGKEMGKVGAEGMKTARIVSGQLNQSLQVTGTILANNTAEMARFAAATALAANTAARMSPMVGQGGLDPTHRGNLGSGGVAILGGGGQRTLGNENARRKLGFDQRGVGTLVGGSPRAGQAKLGILNKSMGKVSSRLGKLTKSIGGIGAVGGGLIASLAGGAIQSQAAGLRESGNNVGGGFADIGGGILAGAGQGALLGSLIGPIGTGVGAAIGGIVGAIKPLTRTFGDAQNTIRELGKEYIKLGLIQTTNGEITSEVTAQIDKVLRDIRALRKSSSGRDVKVDEKDLETAREGALAGVRLGAGEKSKEARRANIVAQLSKPVGLRTGAPDLNLDVALGDPSSSGAKILAKFGNTAKVTEEELKVIIERLGGDVGEISKIFAEETAKIGKTKSSPEEVEKAMAKAAQNTAKFANELNVALPENVLKAMGVDFSFVDIFGITGKQENEEQDASVILFKKALRTTAEGKSDTEAQNNIDQLFDRLGTGEKFVNKEGAEVTEAQFRGMLQDAQILGSQTIEARNLGAKGTKAEAIQNAVNRSINVTDITGIKDFVTRQIAQEEAAVQRTIDAIQGLSQNLSIGDFGNQLDKPVNKFGTILRKFIDSFGREIGKLEELQIRATTSQDNLADVVAANAKVNVANIEKRGERELTTVLKIAREEVQAIPFPEKAIGDSGKKVRDVAKDLFKRLIKANQKILDEGVVEPDRQTQITQDALTGFDKKGIDNKTAKLITEITNKIFKKDVEVRTANLNATLKNNAKQLAALQKRIGDEDKLLALDQRRRQGAAMNARAITLELTGIRRLVAEREIEAKTADGNIEAQKSRIASLDAELTSVNAITKTSKNRAGIEDRLRVLTEQRTNEALTLEEQLTKQRISGIKNALQVSRMAVDAARKVGATERKRTSTLADINSLLSINTSQMDGFNSKLATLGANFRTIQAELAVEATAIKSNFARGVKGVQEDKGLNERQKVIAITKLVEEKEAGLVNIRRRGAGAALDQAKAEAEVIKERRNAIKQVTEELLGNQDEQVAAQQAIIEATQGVAQAFDSYLQAVDGAILATTRYNLGLDMAAVTATKITGGFASMNEELGATQEAFRDAEQLARAMGASEKTLVSIRRESISQQLTLFNDLLSQQSQMARTFFTSSVQDQADLFTGIKEAQGIANLLGGSFEEFKKRGEGAINDLGAQLLALPQETRQRVISSLETLGSVGGTVGGFTADELLTAIETASLGVSGEGLQVDPLFEVQQRIAQLTQEQAQLATEQLISSQEQVVNAKEQLEVAQAAKDLAEIQLDRIKEEGDKLRGKLGELQGSLNTILLQQDQTARQGFSSVTNAIARAANDVVTLLPDAFSVKLAETFRDIMTTGGQAVVDGNLPVSDARPTPPTKGKMMRDAQRASGRNQAENQQRFSQSGFSTANQIAASQSIPNGGGSNNPNDPNASIAKRLEDILAESKKTAEAAEASLVVNEEIRDNTSGTAAENGFTDIPTGTTEIIVNVQGTSTVSVTGFEAGVTRIAAALADTFGGFASIEEARRVANEVLENIRAELLRRGIITPTTL